MGVSVLVYLLTGFDGSITHKALHAQLFPQDAPPPSCGGCAECCCACCTCKKRHKVQLTQETPLGFVAVD